MQHGVGWSTISKIPSCGFSHGAAGISCALLELASLSGKKRFRTTALAAIDYERSLLSPEVGNWPTWVESKTSGQAVRNDQVNEIFSTKWCHGAPGIGLSRLCALRHIDDTEIHAEIQIALKTTLDHGFGYNHSLCHGDLGNLDFLLYASEILKDSRLLFEVNRNADIVLETINKYGWISGVALQVETFGLMVGLAGIGYELLRLAAPKRVPSVLVLAPPDTTPRS